MSWLPILPSFVYWPLAVLLVAGTAWLLLTKRSAARWRFAALVLLLVLAGARPGISGAPAAVTSSELNVFFVVDTTPSVAAEDYDGAKPRFHGMRADILAIAQELAGAHFSLMTFDAKARVVLPLTTDATALRTMTEVLTPRSAYNSQGSSITVADQALAQRLKAAAEAHPERANVVFYLGDGEQTAAAAPKPFKAAPPLIDGGAVLGYGTSKGGPMRDYGLVKDGPGPWITQNGESSTPAVSTIDETALHAIADSFQVPYVLRSAPGSIAPALAKTAPETAHGGGAATGAQAGRWELYWPLALAAFTVALWELAAMARVLPPAPRSARRTGAPRAMRVPARLRGTHQREEI